MPASDTLDISLEKMDVESAKAYYDGLKKEQGVGVKPLALDKVVREDNAFKAMNNKKSALFTKAYESETYESTFVEIPIIYDQKRSMVMNKPNSVKPLTTFEKMQIFRYSFDRLIIYKNKKTGKVRHRLVTYIPDIEYLKRHKYKISQNQINRLDSDFTGFLEYQNWDGTPLYLLQFENGKKLRYFSLKTKIDANSVSSINKKSSNNAGTSSMSCHYESVEIWGQSCIGAGPEDTTPECTPYIKGYNYVQVCVDDGLTGNPCIDYGDCDPGDGCIDYNNCGGSGPYRDCAGVINGSAHSSPCGCIGGTTGITCPTEPLLSAIANKPFALFNDVPCEVLRKWLAVAKFSPDQTIINKLATIIAEQPSAGVPGIISVHELANIQKLDDGYSTAINMDYFSVNISTMPTINGVQYTAAQFLHYLRVNLDAFTGNGHIFQPYNAYGINDDALWNSNSPKGAILALDLDGPDNASVITSYSTTDKWTFTTIHEPMYGDHPVSGNRDFGYTVNANGSVDFYTRGVDRLTTWDATFIEFGLGIPYDQGDMLWEGFQSNIRNFVQNHGGGASIITPTVLRPNWPDVKDVLEGRKPLSTLSKDCPD